MFCWKPEAQFRDDEQSIQSDSFEQGFEGCAPMEGLSSRKSNPFFKGVKILGFFSQIFKAARCGHPTTQSEFPSAQLFIIGHEFIIIILFLFLLP